MKKFKFEFITDNDFEIGDCYDCPLSYVDEYAYRSCLIEEKYYENWKACPLEEVTGEDQIANAYKTCRTCHYLHYKARYKYACELNNKDIQLDQSCDKWKHWEK